MSEDKIPVWKWLGKIGLSATIQGVFISVFAIAVIAGNTTANNIAIFLSIVMFIMALVTLSVAIFIPAEHAKQTKIEVIQFNQWKPYRFWIRLLTVAYLGFAITAAAYAMYWYATVMFVYALALGVWPGYTDKIDVESKKYLLEQLSGSS